jgi:hypothetical protein
MNITKGRKAEAVKAVVYGTEGTGKSSFASLLPDPVFLDVEGSTGNLDVSRVEPKTVAEILSALTEIRTKHVGSFRTVVVDTADWVEAIYMEEMCKAQRKNSIAECSGGYGKGYVELGRKFLDFLDALDAVAAAGMHVVVLAHCKTVKVSPPDQVEGFTRFQLKMNEEHVAAKLKEWAQMVLFVRRDVQLIKGNDDRIKGATTSAEHVIQTCYAPAWDAKNRHDLPEQLPYVKGKLPPQLAAIFAARPISQPSAGATRTAEPVTKPEQKSNDGAGSAMPSGSPAQKVKYATPEQIAAIEGISDAAGRALVESALQAANALEVAELTERQAERLLALEKSPHAMIRLWVEANAEKTKAYAVSKGWIQEGEPASAIPDAQIERIASRPDAFAKAAGIPTLGGTS